MDLIKAAYTFGQTIKTAISLRCDPNFNERFYRCFCCRLAREIKHGTPAEEDFILIQLIHVLFDIGFRQSRDLRHLRSREASAFE